MDEEESDTEDSFELEITPQQLSQVTPWGGVFKLTLLPSQGQVSPEEEKLLP